MVSSGKFNNFFVIDDIIFSKLPVGRSALPQVPLNIVSPENSKFSSLQYKQLPPAVCPWCMNN